jgi:hypothetical protein
MAVISATENRCRAAAFAAIAYMNIISRAAKSKIHAVRGVAEEAGGAVSWVIDVRHINVGAARGVKKYFYVPLDTVRSIYYFILIWDDGVTGYRALSPAMDLGAESG